MHVITSKRVRVVGRGMNDGALIGRNGQNIKKFQEWFQVLTGRDIQANVIVQENIE